MTDKRRQFHKVEKSHLRVLARIAETEREAFFVRNPGQISFYEGRFLMAALCQGAALHYLGRGQGAKDFDIHFFYEQHPVKRQMARKVRSITAQIPDFGRCEVDFIRTVVPSLFLRETHRGVRAVIRRFLEVGPTENARKLAEKAVIGLIPDKTLGAVIWPAT